MYGKIVGLLLSIEVDKLNIPRMHFILALGIMVNAKTLPLSDGGTIKKTNAINNINDPKDLLTWNERKLIM